MTDDYGNVRCATTSTERACCWNEGVEHTGDVIACPSDNLPNPAIGLSTTRVFNGINTYAENYFISQSFGITPESGNYSSQKVATKAPARPNTASYTYSVVSFSTPFIYLPLRGATEKEQACGVEINLIDSLGYVSEAHKRWSLDDRAVGFQPAPIEAFNGAIEDLGYVPQALIDWILQDPYYVAQYPGLATCMPGGPSIKVPGRDGFCAFTKVCPLVQEPVSALTINSETTIQGVGCFHPGACQAAHSPNLQASIQSTPAAAPARMTVQPVQFGVSTTQKAATVPLASAIITPTSSAIVVTTQSSLFPLPKNQVSEPLGRTSADENTPGSSQKRPTPGQSDQLNPVLPIADNQTPTPSSLQAQRHTVVIGPSTLIANSDLHFVINSQTLAPGSSAIEFGGSSYSIPSKPTALIINGSPSPLSSKPSRASDNSYIAQTRPSLNEETAPSNDQASENSEANMASLIMNGFRPVATTTTPDSFPLIAGGARLTSGGPPLIASGVTYSISPSGTAIFVNGSPFAFSVDAESTVGSKANEPLVIGSMTLISGDPAVVVSGNTRSFPVSGTAVIVNGSPSPIPKPADPAKTLPWNAAAGENVYQPFVIGSTTLSRGAPAVEISGTTYSLPSAGAAVVINGSPSSLLASAEITKINADPVVIGGMTLRPGSTLVKISGTTYWLPPHSTTVLINGSPSAIPIPGDNLDHNTSAAPEVYSPHLL